MTGRRPKSRRKLPVGNGKPARSATRKKFNRRFIFWVVAVVVVISLVQIYLSNQIIQYGRDILTLQSRTDILGSEVRMKMNEKAALSIEIGVLEKAARLGMAPPKAKPKTLRVRIPEGCMPPTMGEELREDKAGLLPKSRGGTGGGEKGRGQGP